MWHIDKQPDNGWVVRFVEFGACTKYRRRSR
jgi:hypothetical protein